MDCVGLQLKCTSPVPVERARMVFSGAAVMHSFALPGRAGRGLMYMFSPHWSRPRSRRTLHLVAVALHLWTRLGLWASHFDGHACPGEGTHWATLGSGRLALLVQGLAWHPTIVIWQALPCGTSCPRVRAYPFTSISRACSARFYLFPGMAVRGCREPSRPTLAEARLPRPAPQLADFICEGERRYGCPHTTLLDEQ